MACLTWFDTNSWQLTLGDKCVLIDPWLMGEVVFNNAPWLIRLVRPQPVPMPAQKIDLIVLSQGLADHTHPETLKALDKSIPVVASASAAKVVQALGYIDVTVLAPGAQYSLANDLTIQALPGAPIGPFVTENAYLFTLASGLRLYYEPHGYPSADLQKVAPVDVAITPVVTVTLPVLGPVIQGAQGALALAKLVEPQVILPTADAQTVQYFGALKGWLRSQGSIEQLQAQLQAEGLATLVKPLVPLQPFTLDFVPKTLAE
jgi:L-ascorbate metabolism protein UlaG (beta-lactamase superfamily)